MQQSSCTPSSFIESAILDKLKPLQVNKSDLNEQKLSDSKEEKIPNHEQPQSTKTSTKGESEFTKFIRLCRMQEAKAAKT
jgi:hypothetical protein